MHEPLDPGLFPGSDSFGLPVTIGGMRAFQQLPSPVVLPATPFVTIGALSKAIADAICLPRMVAPFASKLVVVQTGETRFRVPTILSEEERRDLEEFIEAAQLKLAPIPDSATLKRLHRLHIRRKPRLRWLPIPMSEECLRKVFESAHLEALRVRAAHQAALEKWVLDGRLDAVDGRTSAPSTSVNLFTRIATADVPRYLTHARLTFAGISVQGTPSGAVATGTTAVPDAQHVLPNHSKHERWTEAAKDTLCELKEIMTWPQLHELYDIWPSRLQKVRREHRPPSLDEVIRGGNKKSGAPTRGRYRPRT